MVAGGGVVLEKGDYVAGGEGVAHGGVRAPLVLQAHLEQGRDRQLAACELEERAEAGAAHWAARGRGGRESSARDTEREVARRRPRAQHSA